MACLQPVLDRSHPPVGEGDSFEIQTTKNGNQKSSTKSQVPHKRYDPCSLLKPATETGCPLSPWYLQVFGGCPTSGLTPQASSTAMPSERLETGDFASHLQQGRHEQLPTPRLQARDMFRIEIQNVVLCLNWSRVCGCWVVWLFGCLVVWLFGCLIVWLFGCCWHCGSCCCCDCDCGCGCGGGGGGGGCGSGCG